MVGVAYFRVCGFYTLYSLLLYLCIVGTANATYLQPSGEFSAVDVDTGARVYYRADERGYALIDDIILGMHDDIVKQGGKIKTKVLPYSLSTERDQPESTFRRTKRTAPDVKANLLWPHNTVYYSFDEKSDNRVTPKLRWAFIEAVAILHAVSNVRFVEISEADKRKSDVTYLNVQSMEPDNKSCGMAVVGRTHAKAQPFAISRHELCETIPILLHELMHALGLQHEHDRSDRGNYIDLPKKTVDELKTELDLLYPKLGSINLNSDFDFDSIMLYSGVFIKKKENEDSVEELIYTSQQLSKGDIRAINELYPKHFIVPRQIALGTGESQHVSLSAPCDAAIKFSKPAQVEVDTVRCQRDQHIFTIRAREMINFIDSDVIFTVISPRSGT